MGTKEPRRVKVSKSATIDAIVESALRVFSRHGFEGGAVRDIAEKAGVPLSTIHRYFPSKKQLYLEVTLLAWAQISADREKLLNAAFAKSDGCPQLENILHALAYPVVARAHAAESLPMVRLIATAAFAHRQIKFDSPAMRRVPGQWLESIMRECPALARADAVWAYSFVVGAMYSWQMLDQIYDHALPSEEKLSAEEVSEALEVFCAAGFRALEKRRQPQWCPVGNEPSANGPALGREVAGHDNRQSDINCERSIGCRKRSSASGVSGRRIHIDAV